MSEIHVVRLCNPGAVDLPVIQDLFGRAFSNGEVSPSPEAVSEWCREFCGYEGVGVFVARNSLSFRGLAVVDIGRDIWSPAARVSFLWAPDSSKIRDALVDAVADFCAEHGVDRAWAINRTKLDDEEYMRRMSRGEAQVLGSLIEFTSGMEEG